MAALPGNCHLSLHACNCVLLLGTHISANKSTWLPQKLPEKLCQELLLPSFLCIGDICQSGGNQLLVHSMD